MPRKKRLIIGHRYGPQLDPQSIRDLDAFISARKEARQVRQTPVGRRVVEMSEDERRELTDNNPHLVVEEDQPLKFSAMPGLPPRVIRGTESERAVVVRDSTNGSPIPFVTIYGIGEQVSYRADTDESGKATLHTSEPSLRRVIASPRDGYWSRVISDPDASPGVMDIRLKPLMTTGAYDWGARVMGFRRVNPDWTGNEVKIGVIDSGVSDSHEDVRPVGGYNALDGRDPKSWNTDEKGHGTHVAGIIAAQNGDVGVVGGAPNASIYSLKVMPDGYLSDVIEAVEWCIRQQVDVINISLSISEPSRVLAGVLRDAYDRGMTCVASAGNESTAVAYPAAFPTVIAVGAIGRLGTFPEDSAHILKVGSGRDWQGGLFSARFTNFGPQVGVCAPGVAVLSTVPTGYASWDGTSMAAPLVTALAALILEGYPAVRTGDAQQSEMVRSTIYRSAVNLGMPSVVQGYGLPLATRALAGARAPRTTSYFMPHA